MSGALSLRKRATAADLGQPRPIIGIDEAGRGPLAGPVVAAAYCFLCPVFEQEMCAVLDDSKKLSAKMRSVLFDKLMAYPEKGQGITVAIGAPTIDQVNILQATFRAMTEAVQALRGILPRSDYPLFIDGNLCPPSLPSGTAVVKGDGKIGAIAAASILAKVTRDKMMADLHQIYPQFGWLTNQGYGTKGHRDAIEKYGVTRYHRRCFSPCHGAHDFCDPAAGIPS